MSDKKVSRDKTGVKTFLTPDFALIGENIALLDKEVEKCLEMNEIRLVIDFESVPYIDSEGLEKLLEYYNQIRRTGGSLEIFNPNPICIEILNVTCITDYIGIDFNLKNPEGSSK